MIKNKITAQEIESANIQPLFEMRKFFSCFFLVGRVGVRAAPAIMGRVGVRAAPAIMGRVGVRAAPAIMGRVESRIFFWFWGDD